MKNTKILIAVLFILAGLGTYFFFIKKPPKEPSPNQQEKTSLPINTIPVKERPFVTLTPDSSGHNLSLKLDRSDHQGLIEYELIYQSKDKQEGAFGRINLEKEKQPVEKTLLLGSKSAGGSVTYHQDITGGSLTFTYDEVKLKEDFNFTPFDQQDPTFSTKDTRFQAVFEKNALLQNSIVVVMKTFGLPKEINETVLAGPYAVLNSSSTAPSQINIKLSSQEVQPKLYEYKDSDWQELEINLDNNTITASPSSNIFLVTE